MRREQIPTRFALPSKATFPFQGEVRAVRLYSPCSLNDLRQNRTRTGGLRFANPPDDPHVHPTSLPRDPVGQLTFAVGVPDFAEN
ncbi:hypothetical protein ACVWY2_007256 [Bradyrhizobium sp. JR6.1]